MQEQIQQMPDENLAEKAEERKEKMFKKFDEMQEQLTMPKDMKNRFEKTIQEKGAGKIEFSFEPEDLRQLLDVNAEFFLRNYEQRLPYNILGSYADGVNFLAMPYAHDKFQGDQKSRDDYVREVEKAVEETDGNEGKEKAHYLLRTANKLRANNLLGVSETIEGLIRKINRNDKCKDLVDEMEKIAEKYLGKNWREQFDWSVSGEDTGDRRVEKIKNIEKCIFDILSEVKKQIKDKDKE